MASGMPCWGEGNGNPLQFSCLENPMDGGAIAKSQTRLSDFTFIFHFHALEKEMATHSSVLAWGIPRMREAGGLPSMGSHKVSSSSSSSSMPCWRLLAQRGWKQVSESRVTCMIV